MADIQIDLNRPVKPQVWLYYYRYHHQYCQAFPSVDVAMDAAESMEVAEVASTIAIEDEATGQVYDKETMQARWQAELEQRLAEEAANPQEEKPAPPKVIRHFQGEDWELDWNVWADDKDKGDGEA